MERAAHPAAQVAITPWMLWAFVLLYCCLAQHIAWAAPRVNANIGFDQFTDGTTLQTSNFIEGSTWSYFDDESCVGGGNPRKCVLGWRSTISPSSSTSRIEVAYASTYGYTNSTRVVAEVNSTAPSRLYYNICLTQGESVNVSYQFAPRSGVAAQQVRVGLWPINSGYPATPLSFKNSQSRTFSSTTNPGFTTETATLSAPSAGQYQLGLEAVAPSSGSVGNIVDDLTFSLVPLIDLGQTEIYTLKEGGGTETIKALRLRINGTVPSGGIMVALRSTGTAVDQDFQLGTPTGLAGTTPTISHPSPDVWRVFVPAGAYDAGELGDNLRYGITIPIEAVQDSVLENPESLTFALQEPGVDGASAAGTWRRANPVCEGDSKNEVSYNIVPAARVRIAQDNQNTETRLQEKYTYSVSIEGQNASATGEFNYTGNSQLVSEKILLAQGSYTLNFVQSIQGKVPIGWVSDYRTYLSCVNTNPNTQAVLPATTPTTTQVIAFTQITTLTLQNLGDGDDITCTYYNRHEAGSFLVKGRVFTDNSGSTGLVTAAYDGIQQAGEVGLAQALVQLTNCQTTIFGQSLTDAAGDYQFVVPRTVQAGANLCVQQTNLIGYQSVSGGDASQPTRYSYNRPQDRLQWLNTNPITGGTLVNYDQLNFGDAWLDINLSADGQQTIRLGETASYPHQLFISSVITPNIQTVLSQQPSTNNSGWTQILYRDDNCNGIVDHTEQSVSQQPYGIQLPNTVLCVVERVNAPTQVGVGAQAIVVLQPAYIAVLKNGDILSGTSPVRQDVTIIGGARLELVKTVRVLSSCAVSSTDSTPFTQTSQAAYGSYLEYDIAYINNGIKPLQQVHIKDSTPTSTQFISAYCAATPTDTSCLLNQSPSINGAGALDFLIAGSLKPYQQGHVRFCVQIVRP